MPEYLIGNRVFNTSKSREVYSRISQNDHWNWKFKESIYLSSGGIYFRIHLEFAHTTKKSNQGIWKWIFNPDWNFNNGKPYFKPKIIPNDEVAGYLKGMGLSIPEIRKKLAFSVKSRPVPLQREKHLSIGAGFG